MILALHGFWGRGSDWDFLREAFQNRYHVETPSLFSKSRPAFADFEDLTASILSEVSQNSKALLLGYSLGGRIALSLLMRFPERFSGAILLSTHPGLETEAERGLRLEADEKWAQRFLQEDWSSLEEAWNAQAVLATSARLKRANFEEDSRAHLAQGLRALSLGRQPNFMPRLHEISQPLLWLAGEKDQKFLELSRKAASLSPKSPLQPNFEVIPNTGHRAAWDEPELFLEKIETFIRQHFGIRKGPL